MGFRITNKLEIKTAGKVQPRPVVPTGPVPYIWYDGDSPGNNASVVIDKMGISNATNSGLTFSDNNIVCGNDKVAECFNASTILTGYKFSILAWVNPSSQANHNGIAGHHISAYQGVVFCQYNSGGDQGAKYYSNWGTGATWTTGGPGVALSNSTWQMVAVNYDIGIGFSTYKNNLAKTTYAYAQPISHTTRFCLGKAFDTPDRFFQGQIGYLKVYRYLLTDQQVLDEYNNNKTRFGL